MKRFIACLMFALFVFPVFCGAAEEPETKIINALTYHRTMFDAPRGEVYLRVPVGSGTDNVGGSDQDEQRYTSGVPFAFRTTEDGRVWILDSANQALKLFSLDGKAEKVISLKEFGPVVRDFAFDGKSGFWLLGAVSGYIYRIDSEGKLLSQIEGFSDARALESASQGDLLVDMPVMGSILRFGTDEVLREQYPCDETLSMFEGVQDRLLGLEISGKNAELKLRLMASPSQSITLASYTLDIEDPAVTYAGARIIGHDAAGNLYFDLIACHEMGQIYRDRLYRVSPANGKVLASTDIIITACLAPDLPRERVVTADGRVLTFHLEGEDYVLTAYQF